MTTAMAVTMDNIGGQAPHTSHGEIRALFAGMADVATATHKVAAGLEDPSAQDAPRCGGAA